MIRIASCSCGQLTATVREDPVRVSICHCLACQRRTGSVFGAQARFRRQAAEPSGEGREYLRVGDDGGRITFTFCPTCGATVFYSLDVQPDLLAIPVGAFAEPGFPTPSFSVYEERMHGWVVVPEGAERFG